MTDAYKKALDEARAEVERLKQELASPAKQDEAFLQACADVSGWRQERDRYKAALQDLRAKNQNEDMNPRYLNERLDEALK